MSETDTDTRADWHSTRGAECSAAAGLGKRVYPRADAFTNAGPSFKRRETIFGVWPEVRRGHFRGERQRPRLQEPREQRTDTGPWPKVAATPGLKVRTTRPSDKERVPRRDGLIPNSTSDGQCDPCREK